MRQKRCITYIDAAIMPEAGVGAYCRSGVQEKPAPAFLFDNIVGYRGKRLAVNLLSTWPNCALACGLPLNADVRDIVSELCARAHVKGCAPILTEDPPCHKFVETSGIDLFRTLPLFRVNPNDGGFYMHKAAIAFEEPGIFGGPPHMKFRMCSVQVQGQATLGLRLSATDDLSDCVEAAAMRNEPFPIAVCLGVPPLAALVAAPIVGQKTLEYDVISSLFGQPMELAQCATSSLLVPARSEFVIEGYIEPGVRRPEGPSTTDGGQLQPLELQPQVKVTAVAHRERPILDNAYVGGSWTERDCMMGIATALRLHQQGDRIAAEVARSGTRARGTYLRVVICNLHDEEDPEKRK